MTPLVVEHGYLCRNGALVPVMPTPNMSGPLNPEGIVLHDTAGPSLASATNWLRQAEAKASAHVVVDFDGSIVQMVPFDRQAWHAGKSSWNGRSNVNGFMVGIEIVNPGALSEGGRAWFHKAGQPGYAGAIHKATKEHGDAWWLSYPQAQVDAVIEICQALVKAYPKINAPERITTHWFISPGRKVDTNPLFPLEGVRAAAFATPVEAPTPAIASTGRTVLAEAEPTESDGNYAEVMQPVAEPAETVAQSKPIAKTVQSSRTVFGTLLAAIGVVLVEAKEVIAEAANQIVSLAPAREILGNLGLSATRIATIITVAGLGYAIYARLHDAKTGANVKGS